MPVIPLVEEPDSEELRELYERLSQTMPGIGVLNIFKVMAHNPRVLRDWLRLATPLLTGGLTLSPRLREIAILRVAQVCGSEYEFAHHIRIAQQAGLTEAEIAHLQDHDESELFSDLDRAVVRYTDACANLSPDGAGPGARAEALAVRPRAPRAELLRRALGDAGAGAGPAGGAGGRGAGGDAAGGVAGVAVGRPIHPRGIASLGGRITSERLPNPR